MPKFDKDRWVCDALRNRYLIAIDDGSIYRCQRAAPNGELLSTQYRLVKQQIHKKSGRVYFNMTWKGVTKSVLVNRVIALRYLPNPFHLPQVNHLNGDKEFNAKSNLEWASASDNEKHAHRNGLKTGRGSSNSNAKLTAAEVREIRASVDPIPALAEQFGVSRSTINNIVRRRTWQHV